MTRVAARSVSSPARRALRWHLGFCALAALAGLAAAPRAEANDMYAGLWSTPGTVQPAATVADGSAANWRHPLRRTAVLGNRLVVSAVRTDAGPSSPGTLRIEVPVYSRDLQPLPVLAPIAAAGRDVHFSVDVGMWSGRAPVPTPRYDPNGQISRADLDGDPATLRDDAGRIRRVPRVNLGVNLRF